MLLPHYRDKVFRLTFSMLRDRALAEDTTQDIFLRVWRALPGFAGQSQLSTWIYAISKNACLSELRKRRPQVSLDTRRGRAVTPRSRPWPPEDADDSATVSVGQLLDQLPERYRQAVVLFYMEDKSYEQTAAEPRPAAGHGQSLAPSGAQAPNRADEAKPHDAPPAMTPRTSLSGTIACRIGWTATSTQPIQRRCRLTWPTAPMCRARAESWRRSTATCAARPRAWRWTMRSTRRLFAQIDAIDETQARRSTPPSRAGIAAEPARTGARLASRIAVRHPRRDRRHRARIRARLVAGHGVA